MNKLQDVVIVRTISIIGVVAFHAYGMMCASAHFPATQQVYNDIYFRINQCGFINIAMPLFVFISGYLFSFLLLKGKYVSYMELLKNKSTRLIIPYLFFTVIMMLTTNNFSWRPLYAGGYWHLWYIPMLLWCFVICYPIHKIARDNLLIKFLFLSLFLCLYFIPPSEFPLFGIKNLNPNICWFYLGYMFFPYREKIIQIIAKYYLALPLLIIYVMSNVLYVNKYGDYSLSSIISSFSGLVLLWFIINKVIAVKSKIADITIIKEIDKTSFGIYIFHNWFQMYMISRTAQNILPLEQWAADHVVLFPLLFFISSFILSYIATKITLKTHIGRFLIG